MVCRLYRIVFARLYDLPAPSPKKTREERNMGCKIEYVHTVVYIDTTSPRLHYSTLCIAGPLMYFA